MGTRGLQVWRFRKRYYSQYNSHDSYPSGLGKSVADKIPKDRDSYLAWLESERQKVKQWEATWDECLVVRIDDDEPMYEGQGIYPSWVAPISGGWIQWLYILDLDREVFSVNDGAHFKLDQVPHINWIAALADGALGDKILLPKPLSEEAIANAVATPSTVDCDLFGEARDSGNRTVRPARRIVKPKTIADIGCRCQHGPSLRWMIFSIWSQNMHQILTASLLQWSTPDLPFRETAFAALCIASGSQNIVVLPADKSKSKRKHNDLIALADQISEGSDDEKSLPKLRESPGSSPEKMIYWLDDVLVMLATQLYRPQVVDESVAFIAQYCRILHPQDTIDAVLISIEHVVLVHIFILTR